MNWLIDTHLVVFSLVDPEQLTQQERAILTDPGNRIFVSLASIWEIAVKNSLSRGHRRPIRLTARTALEAIDASGFELLPITSVHVCKVEDLPPLHGDPFDRLLIAQAVSEQFRMLTRDWLIRRYFEGG